MKDFMKYFLVLGIVFPLAFSGLNAQNVKLKKQVVGSGGWVGVVNSKNVKMSGTTGQLAIEKRSNQVVGDRTDVYQGFWTPAPVEEPNSVVDPYAATLQKELTNSPNPFAHSTKIQYTLPGSALVNLKVYDLSGNVVAVLVDEYQNEGDNYVHWDAKDVTGQEVTSGSYIYELRVQPAQMAGDPGFEAYTLRNVMIVVR